MGIMKFLKLIPIFFIFFGSFPYKNFVHAEVKDPSEFKVFSTNNKKLSIANVKWKASVNDSIAQVKEDELLIWLKQVLKTC